MLVVGALSEFDAYMVEWIQHMSNNVSAGNHQDYYANELGRQFYAYWSTARSPNTTNFATMLQQFLLDPTARTSGSLVDPAGVRARCP